MRRSGRARPSKQFTCRYCGRTFDGGKSHAKAKRVHEVLCPKREAASNNG